MGRRGSRKVQVSFSAGHLTHFGGVFLLHCFLQQLHIRTFLSERLRTDERNNHFSVTERLFALLYPMILGLEKIELSSLLGTNGVFQYLTGLPRFPNPTTLRRFLVGKSANLLPRLHAAHDALRAHFLELCLPVAAVCLDFDSTARTLYGNQEGAAKGYNPQHRGRKSYHPLICTEAHCRACLGGALRYGNAHTAAGVKEMLDEVLALPPKDIHSIRVRADAGFYDGDFVAQLSQNRVRFAIVARMTARFRHKVPGLRYAKVTPILSAAEFRYKPHGWDKKYRFVVLREKLTEKRDTQLTLFKSDAYSYHVIVTDLPLMPYGVFAFYEDRAGLERIIRIARDDYSFGTAPTNNFQANALYAELSMLAYNLVVWFKLLCLPEDWQTYTVGTLRHKLLLIPGIFTKTGNYPVLKLPRNCLYQKEFLSAEKRIKKLKPLV